MLAYLPATATLLVALIGVFSAIYSYRSQKETDRHVELRNRRMKDYESYLSAYASTFAWVEEGSPEEAAATKEYWRAYNNLFQVASDPVLLAVTDLHTFAWLQKTELSREDWAQGFRRLYADMILKMRVDAFERTELERHVVEQRLPFDLAGSHLNEADQK